MNGTVKFNPVGNGDCGFASLAAYVAYLALDQQLTEQQAHILVDEIEKYYPHYFEDHMSFEQKQQTLLELPKTEIIQILTYTLRQIAVDRMYDQPWRYQGAFVASNSEQRSASAKDMRQPGTWIDHSALHAVASKLDLPVTVRHSTTRAVGNSPAETQDYVIHQPKQTSSSVKPAVLQLNGGHYAIDLKLNSPETKKFFSQPQTNRNPLVKPVVFYDPSPAEVEAKIAEHTKNVAATMDEIELGLQKLSNLQLFKLFKTAAGNRDFLLGHPKYVLEQFAGQSFEQLLQQPNLAEGLQNDALLNATLAHAVRQHIYTNLDYDGNLPETLIRQLKAEVGSETGTEDLNDLTVSATAIRVR